MPLMEKLGLKKRDPKEIVREQCRELKRGERKLDNEIRNIKRDEAKAKQQIKMLAKANNVEGAKIMAKTLITCKKSISKLHVAKQQMVGVQQQLKHTLAQQQITKAIGAATPVMHDINQLTNVPAVQETMMKFTKEMTKADLMDEMVEDAMESVFEVDESAIDKEVDEALWEVTGGLIGTAPAASTGALPTVASKETEDTMNAMIAQAAAALN